MHGCDANFCIYGRNSIQCICGTLRTSILSTLPSNLQNLGNLKTLTIGLYDIRDTFEYLTIPLLKKCITSKKLERLILKIHMAQERPDPMPPQHFHANYTCYLENSRLYATLNTLLKDNVSGLRDLAPTTLARLQDPGRRWYQQNHLFTDAKETWVWEAPRGQFLELED